MKWVLVVGVVLVTAGVACAADVAGGAGSGGTGGRIVPTDLVEWAAPERVPRFGTGVDENVYQMRRVEDLAKIDKTSLGDASIPIGGLLISAVDAKGEAAERHFKVGDIITKINGETALAEKYEAACFNSDGFELTVWSLATGEREEKFPAGMIGVTFKNYIDMPRAYWQSRKRNEGWDDDMLVAATEYKQRPRIAQAALSRAQGAGCREPFLSIIGAFMAYEEERMDEVLRLGLPVVGEAPAEVRAQLAWELWHASIAMGHLAITEALVRDNSEYFTKQMISVGDSLTQFLKDYRALPEADRVVGEPFAEMGRNTVKPMETLEHEEFIPTIDPNSIVNDTGFNAALVNAWTRGHVWHYTAPPENSAQSDFGPPLANCEATVEFTCRIHETHGRLDYGSFIEVGLLNYSASEKKGRRLGSIGTTPDGYVQTTWENLFGMWKPRAAGALPASANGKHVIRVAVFGQRLEASIDGRVMLNSVISEGESARHIEGFVSITGIAGAVTNVTWKEIERGAGETMP